MATYRSDFLRLVSEREHLNHCTDLEGLDAAAAKGIAGYIGFDLTAPSLHVGSLMVIMLLRRLQQSGNKPIVVLGGGTTRIGDPSGKDETRKMLSPDQIGDNKRSLASVFEKFLRFGSGPTDAVFVDNADWLLGLSYIDFLRDVGQHFSVNRMLSMDSVKSRLAREQQLSFTEFNYMILQAYDFVELYRRSGVVLQMGAADQWGNILNGVDLGRRMQGIELFGLTTSLLTTASGAKMGKTAAGAVWLNADLLSPYDYWQFWRNVGDADVGRFLKLFTDLPLDELRRLEALKGSEINEAKKILATETTAMLHGSEAALLAERGAIRLFEHHDIDPSLPSVAISTHEIANGINVVDAFERAGLVGSKGEARRFVKAGTLKVDDVTVSDPLREVFAKDSMPGKFVKLSLGKKKHVLLRVS